MGTMNMFTKDEQTILKNTSAKYKWIARDKNGDLFVYAEKPKKHNTIYLNDSHNLCDFRIEPFEGLFKKVTWEVGPVQFRKDVLDETERKYLKAVFRPFRNRVVKVVKLKMPASSYYYLWVGLEDGYGLAFPSFPAGTMYNGMELHHEYTLEELGITY